MSRGKNDARAELLRVLGTELGRKANMAILMFSTAVADRLGLSLTDMFCGELLSRTGPITAGELAELTGLTTGAITGVVDRLEKSGHVRREHDPHDRRRVMLRALPEYWAEKGATLYQGLNKRLDAIFAQHDDRELATIAHFLDQMAEAYDEEAAVLRTNGEVPAVPSPQLQVALAPRMRVKADVKVKANVKARIRIGNSNLREFSAPLRDVTRARLEFASGPSDVYLVGMPDSADLIRARFEHTRPDVRADGGTISMLYRQWRLFGREGGKADMQLNTAVPWELDFQVGASVLEADLRLLDLRALRLKMGGSKIEMNLPPPGETVTLYFETSNSHIDLVRPSGIPVRVETDGNYSKLSLDGEEESVGKGDVFESPGYKRAGARYLVQIVGRANQIEIDTI